MSSHHFVREGQEPALCIIHPISFGIISDLLEWAPLVLVSQDALEDVLRWGIKIDVMLRNPNLPAQIFSQGNVEVLTPQPGESAIHAAMLFLEGRQYKDVNITAFDAEQAFDEVLPFHGRVQANVLDEKVKWSAVSAVFEKWLPAGTVVLVHGTTTQTTQFQGLTEGNNQWLVPENGMVRIQSPTLFWVGEPFA